MTDTGSASPHCATCGGGCAASSRKTEPQPLPDDANRLKWWLELSRRQTARLWELLPEYLDEKAQTDILNALGRSCAKNAAVYRRSGGLFQIYA